MSHFVKTSAVPIWIGIASQIREQIAAGNLAAGDRIASSRVLARDLGVSRGTVLAALELLAAEGLLEGRQGSGTFVAQCAKPRPPRRTRAPALPPRARKIAPDVDPANHSRINFQACRPSLEAFPVAPWRRAFAAAAEFTYGPDYGDPRGEPRLREAIASYLGRSRGLSVTPSEILISSGMIQALQLLTSLYIGTGGRVVMEDPGYPLARQVFKMHGAQIVSCGVDRQGLRVEDLPDLGRKNAAHGGRLRLLYVTPSHQFPTGSRLSLERRARLLDWSARHGVLVLEDDYDGEFRYDVPPLAPLAAMARTTAWGHVAYLGSFSKTLFPSLRLGFVAAPEELIDELAACRNVADYQSGAVPQIALARFIEDGEFERHILRMRRIYAKKRRVLSDAIEAAGLPGELSGTDSGINGMIRLSDGPTASEIAAGALKRGVNVTPLARYSNLGTIRDDAIILGYGACSEDQIREGVQILAEVIRK